MTNETIFFSYSSEDRQFALDLATCFREAGVSIWMGQLDIKPGENWDNWIESAIESCHTILIILSKNSVKSNNVMDEYSMARNLGKRVVLILLEECEIPMRLSRLQYADFSNNSELGMKTLTELLQFNNGIIKKLDFTTNNLDQSSTVNTKNVINSTVQGSGNIDIPTSDNLDIPIELNKQRRVNESEVSINVYSSPKFDRGEQQLIQIWMFTPKHEKEVNKSALSIDDEALKLGFENLLIPIEPGTEVMLALSSQDIQFHEQKSFQWLGKISNKNFRVEIPSTFKKDKVFFTLEIYINQMIVGEITFMLKARNKFLSSLNSLLGKNEGVSEPIGDKAKRFKKAFISYTSKDRLEVLQVVRGIAAADTYEIFQDIMSLDAGERWEKRLYKEIDSCDVFFLFWSEASSNSPWVIKEMEYALAQKRDDIKYPLKIQPVIIPPMVKPPEQLNHLHFNDKIIPFIIAEEQIRKSQEKK